MSPIVSVIIPAYNSADHIVRAISSALEQTLSDIELIVVDDGSTDDTEPVINQISDPRVRYVRQARQERSAARNHGLALACGRYVAFLDADDWWQPTKLEKQVALLEANPDTVLVHCWLQSVLPDGRLGRLQKSFQQARESGGAQVFERLLLGGLPGPSSTIVIRTATAAALGGFNTGLRYGEDWEFVLRVAVHGSVGFVPEALAYYRLYGSYLPSRMHSLGQQQAFPRIVEAAAKEAGLNSDEPLFRRAMARAHYSGAFVDAGIGDFEGANRRLECARDQDPTLFASARPPIIPRLAHFARCLNDTETPLDQSLAYVAGLLSHLDLGMVELRTHTRQAVSYTMALRVFETAQEGDAQGATGAFIGAVLRDPSWLANIGFLKLGLRTLIS